MKKLTIAIWGILLLIRQGTIIGSEVGIGSKVGAFTITASNDDLFTGSFDKPLDLSITFRKGNIIDTNEIDAIVNPANFELEHGGGVAAALAGADPEWNKRSKRKLKKLGLAFKFKENGTRAFITQTDELQKQNVKWIINAVGPKGSDQNWKKNLKKTYIDTLTVAHTSKLKSLIFPPISTGIFSRNKKGEVIITPTQAAQTAISAVKKFFQDNPESPIKNIYFISRWVDEHTHLLAYKKALEIKLTAKEKNDTSEERYIWNLEKHMRHREILGLAKNMRERKKRRKTSKSPQTKLPIKQRTIIGAEVLESFVEPGADFLKITNAIGGKRLTIIVEQGDIAQTKGIDAIVNQANFDLSASSEIAKALKTDNTLWDDSLHQKYLEYLRSENSNFRKDGTRAIITPTSKLINQRGSSTKHKTIWIIHAVGPQGNDVSWRETLKQTYLDTLTVANDNELISLIFPPISTDISSLNAEKNVVITPTIAAQIAISAVNQFYLENPESSLEEIHFISHPDNGLTHLLAYKKALGIELTDEEQSDISEQLHIRNLKFEATRRFVQSGQKTRLPIVPKSESPAYQDTPEVPSDLSNVNFIKKFKKWRAALGAGALVILLYLAKKHYFSR